MRTRIVVATGIVREAVLLKLTPLYCLRIVDRLIDPVPDTSAYTVLASLDYIPIILQVTYCITHGMRILAKEERLAADTVGTMALGVGEVRVHL